MLEWNCPFAKWFVGGRLNVAENCVDRHLDTRRDKPAIVWEGEPGDKRTLTYAELHAEVCRFANVLKAHGVAAGDRVLIYLPLVPEAAVAMLACARIGAVHSVVFGGFSAESIKDRLADSGAKLIVTADGGWRRGKVVPLKANVDAALKDGDGNVSGVIVLRRAANAVEMKDGRDVWWHDETGKASADAPAEAFDSEHPLFILYTSGSTGKPKGILHTSAGYLLGAYATTKYVFDLREDDVYWCTADVGWITGHSYVVYGPLANGATVLMYEGAPDTPAQDRWWELIAEHKVTVLLHRADGDPRVHQMGRPVAGRARSFIAASARHGGRADQPGSVDVVPRKDRRQPLPHRRYVVADGNRRAHDRPAAGRDADDARHGDATLLRGGRGHRGRRGQRGRPERGRQARHPPAVAVDAADDLRRRRTLRQERVLERVRRQGILLHRRRRAA